MLSNLLINKSRFPAPACIAVVVCAPLCNLADIIAIFNVVSGHHEQLSISIGKLGNLDTVTIDRGES